MPYIVPQLRTIHVDRYIKPMNEGGSIPGLIVGDDGGKYVIKFKGAAQGPKVLIAELIGGEIARALGLNMPELVFAELDAVYGRTEHNEDIQAQFKSSVGLNIAVEYLPGSITFDPTVKEINAELASHIVWLDCLIMNVDRTANNTNMLLWNNGLWLIDHGSSLTFHFRWGAPPDPEAMAVKHFDMAGKHVLLKDATKLDEVNKINTALLTADVIHGIVKMIPDAWLITDSPYDTIQEHRQAYERFLLTRINHSKEFVKAAKDARKDTI